MFDFDEAVNNSRFTPSPDESALYSRLFRSLDSENKAYLSNTVAIPFLFKSRLPQNVLRDIWAIVDPEQSGVLNTDSFFKTCKLISLAQNGKPPTLANINSLSPLPIFEGAVSVVDPQHPTSSAKRFPSVSIPPYYVSAEEKDRFRSAFANCGPVNGLVTGEAARAFFIKSGLPIEILSKIWTLADSTQSGSLKLEQFMVAMYFMMKMKAGVIQQVPSSIPPALWAAVTGDKTPASPSPLAMDVSTFHATNDSQMPHDARSQYEQHFEVLDKARRGFLSGQDSYEFFLKSKLPEAELARIWDVSDKSKSGKLTKDEFSNAMWMIKQSMSAGGSNAPSRQSVTSSPAPPVDLLDFSSPPTPTVPVATFATQRPNEAAKQPPPTGLRSSYAPPPFSSSFSTPLFQPAAPSDQDADLKQKRMDIKDIEKQFETLKPANEEQKAKRAAIDAEYKSLIDQKHTITIKLSQARALYDAESQILADTQNILGRETQMVEMSRQELGQLENALELLKHEKEKIESFVNSTHEETERCKTKIAEYMEKGAGLRTSLEQLRNEMLNSSKILEVNQKLLVNAQSEYQQIKLDLQASESRIEHERSRSTQMQSQIAVQSAITEKERQKMKNSNLNLNMTSADSSTSQPAMPYASLPIPIKNAARDDFDYLFEANKPKKSSSPSRSDLSSPPTSSSPNMAAAKSVPSLYSETASPVVKEGSIRSFTLDKAVIGSTANPPPLPPQSTKPTHPPGASSIFPGQDPPFAGLDLSSRSSSPEKFQNFGDKKFDFDSAFGTSPTKSLGGSERTPLGKDSFDAAFGNVDIAMPEFRAPSPVKSLASPGKEGSSPKDTIPEVASLVSMGFTREVALVALEKHAYNVEAATNELLK